MKNSKTLKIVLIIFLSLLAIFIIWLMVNLISGKFNIKNFRLFSTVSDELVLDETYDIDFNKIDIKVATAEIYIKESNNNEVKVVIYGDKDKTSVNTDNNELVIDIEDKVCIGLCFNSISKIEVYLPSNYDDLIKIDNQYGDIEVENFMSATVDIKEASGDVSVVGADIIKINNEYGDIEIGEVNEADIQASAGDVNIESVNDAKVKNEYGDIEINNINNYLDIENDCGDINIDNVILNKNGVIKASLGDIEIGKTNEIYIDAKTNLGDVKIANNYHKSDITLKIENDCGDIEVDN